PSGGSGSPRTQDAGELTCPKGEAHQLGSDFWRIGNSGSVHQPPRLRMQGLQLARRALAVPLVPSRVHPQYWVKPRKCVGLRRLSPGSAQGSLTRSGTEDPEWPPAPDSNPSA